MDSRLCVPKITCSPPFLAFISCNSSSTHPLYESCVFCNESWTGHDSANCKLHSTELKQTTSNLCFVSLSLVPLQCTHLGPVSRHSCIATDALWPSRASNAFSSISSRPDRCCTPQRCWHWIFVADKTQNSQWLVANTTTNQKRRLFFKKMSKKCFSVLVQHQLNYQRLIVWFFHIFYPVFQLILCCKASRHQLNEAKHLKGEKSTMVFNWVARKQTTITTTFLFQFLTVKFLFNNMWINKNLCCWCCEQLHQSITHFPMHLLHNAVTVHINALKQFSILVRSQLHRQRRQKRLKSCQIHIFIAKKIAPQRFASKQLGGNAFQ